MRAGAALRWPQRLPLPAAPRRSPATAPAPSPTADGLSLKYNSRSGTHNMYKEYRAVSLCNAVDQVRARGVALRCATR